MQARPEIQYKSLPDPVLLLLQRKLDTANAELEQHDLQQKLSNKEAEKKQKIEAIQKQTEIVSDLQVSPIQSSDKKHGELFYQADLSCKDQQLKLLNQELRTLEANVEQLQKECCQDADWLELKNYIQKLEIEIREHNEKIREEAPIPENMPGITNWVKRKYRALKKHLLPATITTADLAGSVGFVTNIYIKVLRVGAVLSEASKFFFETVSSPLALAAMGVATLMDTYAVWNDARIKQRKTRYGSNLINLAIIGVAIPIILGVIATPMFVVPMLFLGFSVVGYIKEEYIAKQTRRELQEEELALETKKAELQKAIHSFLSHKMSEEISATHKNAYQSNKLRNYYDKNKSLIQHSEFQHDSMRHEAVCNDLNIGMSQTLNNDPKIRRLSMQVNEHKDKVASLKLSLRHMNENKNVRKAFLFSTVCLVTGAIFLLVPPLAPLAAFFTLLGAAAILGAIFTATYLRYKQKNETIAVEKANNSRKPEEEEGYTIREGYKQELNYQAYQDKKQTRGKCVSTTHTIASLSPANTVQPNFATSLLKLQNLQRVELAEIKHPTPSLPDLTDSPSRLSSLLPSSTTKATTRNERLFTNPQNLIKAQKTVGSPFTPPPPSFRLADASSHNSRPSSESVVECGTASSSAGIR